ncbi:hypothetical protein SCUCBS95973_005329 [Sporothrix curviconia]|uniref:Uncharacterized protein n=1 Tax=Sporothrix curviconia TaxID=1260050 RepID=A0ABP0BWA2_9PEZI
MDFCQLYTPLSWSDGLLTLPEAQSAFCFCHQLDRHERELREEQLFLCSGKDSSLAKDSLEMEQKGSSVETADGDDNDDSENDSNENDDPAQGRTPQPEDEPSACTVPFVDVLIQQYSQLVPMHMAE